MRTQGSQEILHLPDIGCFTVQQFLADGTDLLVLPVELMDVLQSFDHTFCISLDHHVGDLGVSVTPGELGSCHHVSHEPDCRVQFRQLPTSLGCDGVGLAFDGIVFLKLGFQRFSQAGPHTGLQHTADTDLSHLCGF